MREPDQLDQQDALALRAEREAAAIRANAETKVIVNPVVDDEQFIAQMRRIVNTGRGLPGEGVRVVVDGESVSVPKGFTGFLVLSKND